MEVDENKQIKELERFFQEKEALKVLFVGVAALGVSLALPHAYLEWLMEEQQSRGTECGF